MKIVPDIPSLGMPSKQQEERKAPAEFHFVGSVRRVRGHTLFSFNWKTGEWKQAPLQREAKVGIDGKPVFKTTVAREPNCVYIQALNLENAKKRLYRENPILKPLNYGQVQD